MCGRLDECATTEPAAKAFFKNKCHATNAHRFLSTASLTIPAFFEKLKLRWLKSGCLGQTAQGLWCRKNQIYEDMS
jgi:hypothetical protein